MSQRATGPDAGPVALEAGATQAERDHCDYAMVLAKGQCVLVASADVDRAD
jgi:hypothetical protein